jgi:hypothetical protein
MLLPDFQMMKPEIKVKVIMGLLILDTYAGK